MKQQLCVAVAVARPFLSKSRASVAASSSALFAWYLVALSLPLVLFSFELPVPTWDFFTGVPLYLPFGWSDFSSIWRNIVHNTFGEMDKVRPTLALVYQAHYAAFGGELWVWYLVRWLAKLAALLAIDWSLRRLRVTAAARAVVLSAAAFQPAVFELMPTSADGWLALFFSLVVAITTASLPRPDEQPIQPAGRRGLLAALTLAGILTLGTKEAGLAVTPILVFASIILGRSVRERAAFSAVALIPVAFFAWRIAVAASHRTGERNLGAWLERVLIELRFVGPHLPTAAWWLLAAAASWAGTRAIRRQSRRHLWLALMCSTTAGGLLILTSVPGSHAPAPRYIVPILFLLGVPLAMLLDELPRRTTPALWLVAITLPLIEMGDITSQYAGYSQTLREYADVVAELRSRSASGNPVAMSGQNYELAQYAFGLEEQASTKMLLEHYGPRFYHERPVRVLASIAEATANERFSILTVYPPRRVAEGAIAGLTLDNVESISTVRRRTRGGALSYARTWKRLEKAVGVEHGPTFDVGAPGPSEASRFFIYDVSRHSQNRAACMRHSQADSLTIPIAQGQFEHVLNPERPYDYKGLLAGPLVIRIPLGDLSGPHAVLLNGTASVQQGSVVLAISDANGNDLWNTLLTPETKPGGLGAIPALDFPAKKEYYAVLFVPEGMSAKVALDDIAMACVIPIKQLEPSRGYGTLSD